jgi:hypothetical protein
MINESQTIRRTKTIFEAIYRLYEHSGFSMAGAVAFSFVVSLFPFCIFLGALGSIFGDKALATQAVDQLFQILPKRVAEGLAPEVGNIMGQARIDLLGLSGLITLFFATSAIETLRAALNGAYRVKETRPYLLCLVLTLRPNSSRPSSSACWIAAGLPSPPVMPSQPWSLPYSCSRFICGLLQVSADWPTFGQALRCP